MLIGVLAIRDITGVFFFKIGPVFFFAVKIPLLMETGDWRLKSYATLTLEGVRADVCFTKAMVSLIFPVGVSGLFYATFWLSPSPYFFGFMVKDFFLSSIGRFISCLIGCIVS